MYYILLFAFLALVTDLLMLYRSEQVYKYRTVLHGKVSKQCDLDIDNNRDWHRRYVMLDSVSYEYMLLHFWQPLDSFYDLEKLLGEQK